MVASWIRRLVIGVVGDLLFLDDDPRGGLSRPFVVLAPRDIESLALYRLESRVMFAFGEVVGLGGVVNGNPLQKV